MRREREGKKKPPHLLKLDMQDKTEIAEEARLQMMPFKWMRTDAFFHSWLTQKKPVDVNAEQKIWWIVYILILGFHFFWLLYCIVFASMKYKKNA